MKKQVFFLVIINMLFALFLTLLVFDSLSVGRCFNAVSKYNNEISSKQIFRIQEEEYVNNIDSRSFHEKLEELALKHDIFIYKFVPNVNSDPVKYDEIYLTKNDQFIIDSLLLKNDKLKDLEKTYTTNAIDDSNKIVSFFSENKIRVSNIKNDNSNAGYYNLFNLNPDKLDNFNLFYKDILKEYPDLVYINQDMDNDIVYSDNEFIKGLYQNKGIKLIIGFIVTILLTSKIFSMQKKISALKLEGYANYEIYYNYFLKHYILYSFVIYVLMIIIFKLVYINGNEVFSWLFTLFNITYLQILLISLVVSIYIYFYVKAIPINISVKGANYLDEVQIITYTIKTGILIMLIPIIIPSFLAIKNNIIISYRQDHVINDLKGLYTFSYNKMSNYHKDLGSDRYIAFRDQLVASNNLFAQSKAFLLDGPLPDDINQLEHYYVIDKSYALKVGLMNENDNFDEISIFINDEINVNIDEFKQKILTTVRDPININVIESDLDLKSYNISDLLYHDAISKLPVVYHPEEKNLEGQIANNLFYFNGDIVQARQYIDDMFKLFGYAPAYDVASLETNYLNSADGIKKVNTKQIIEFMILMIGYFVSSVLLVNVDMDNNSKKYFVARVEGQNPYHIGKYFVKFTSCHLIALMILLMSNRLRFNMAIVLGLLILELINYGYYLYKINHAQR